MDLIEESRDKEFESRDKELLAEKKRRKQLDERRNKRAKVSNAKISNVIEEITFLGSLILNSSAKAHFDFLMATANEEGLKYGPVSALPIYFKAVAFFQSYSLEELTQKPADFTNVDFEKSCPLCDKKWGTDTLIDQRSFHWVGKKHWNNLIFRVFRSGYEYLPPRLNNIFLEIHHKDWSSRLLPDKSVNPRSTQASRQVGMTAVQVPDFGNLFRKSEQERARRISLENDRERKNLKQAASEKRHSESLPQRMDWTLFEKDIFPAAVSVDDNVRNETEERKKASQSQALPLSLQNLASS